MEITGGQLSETSGPASSFKPKAVDIRIYGLPAGWSAGAGRCHTVEHDTHPRIAFDFSDGFTTGAKLTAQGYKLDGGPTAPFGHRTFITLCRDKTGRISKFSAQLDYIRFRGNVIDGYGPNAQNISPVSGSSSVQMTSLLENAGSSSATFSSNAVNRLHLR